MGQILDFFEMLSAAAGDDGKLISWRLVSISMESPVSATAESFSDIPGVPVNEIAQREKATLAKSIEDLTARRPPPSRMRRPMRRHAQAFFERNTRSIGRTVINFDDAKPLTVIVDKTARDAALVLKAASPPISDLSRMEAGSIEGYVAQASRFYGRPAVGIRELLTNTIVTCVFSEELAERIGVEHNWRDIWRGRRVLVSGNIVYRQDGAITRVIATDMVKIEAQPLGYADIADPNFTGGLRPADYLNELWEDEVG
ncbi:MAG: hypothetical protein ACRD22_11020 [Terriglobia bacterium]